MGDNSIIVIEVKGYSGDIYGNIEDKYFRRTKTFKSGKVYENKIYNPLKR